MVMTTEKAELQQKMMTTRVYQDNLAAWLGGMRRALNEGGTASSKTYSIIQTLIMIARYARRPLLTSIVSESMPHLKRGAIRDFMNIMGPLFHEDDYNRTEHQYHFDKAVIEFFGADEAGKIRGPRRDILFLNEANNIPWETARGLDIRTALFTFADWNPVSEFWVHQYETEPGKMIPGWIAEKDSVYIHSTYLDAMDVLPPEVVTNIENNKKDPNWWNIYGLGRIGKVEGLVYPHFDQCDALPEAGQTFFGLDFGFSTDPTVLVKCVIKDGCLYSQELLYDTGLTNDVIAARMVALGVRKKYDEIYADAAEPKSIEEIHRFNFNVKPCPKGADSVEFGHQKVRQYKQYWTKDSLNCIKEQRNFRYVADKDGKLTDKTAHAFSHGMDARRYGVIGSISNSSAAWKAAIELMRQNQGVTKEAAGVQ